MVKKALVTGATGYVGGRLVTQLLAEGFDVRVMARHPEKMRDYPWISQVEVVQGDAEDASSIHKVLSGVEIAYYMLHSLSEHDGYEIIETRMATNFGKVAKESGVKRIVYLGGISPVNSKLSIHLESRRNTGEILRNSGVPTTELRAAIILGSGSASFEMLRYLTERLPFMITPKWLNNRVQPIAIRDVLHYLVKAGQETTDQSHIGDIGGPDVMYYKEMMQRYAKVAGLRPRTIVTVPVLTPRLSSHWVSLVTPVPRRLALPLVDSLVNEVVVSEELDVRKFLPEPENGLLDFNTAVEYALNKVRNQDVQTRWSSASVPGAPSEPLPTDPDWSGGSLYVDLREQETTETPENLWKVIEGIGGKNGYYSLPFLWEIRGLFDRLIGGVGLRRGRRDPEHLYVGETVDFWRVERCDRGQLLRLRAEMKLPGLAWLELIVDHTENGKTLFRQRATYRPSGLFGHIYWWAVAPFHVFVFGFMVKRIPAKAEKL
ncbi:MAG: SDR family oxidoreductase [Actinobacteria bacterium]|nr:SDR family oxidoreductase [Actinomycetota bacterium]